MDTERIPRHAAWRRMYRDNRYCENLSQSELDRRIRDVFLNNLSLTEAGKIGLLPIDAEGMRWMELWTHVLEEMVLRYGPYPNGFTRNILHSEPFPDFVGKLGQAAASVFAKKHLKPGDVFLKFGKAKHMRALYERGELRVQPASYYATQSHNGAVRDDELSLPLSFSLTRDEIIQMVANPEDVPGTVPPQRLDVSYRIGTDYWLYCLTTVVQPRLFVDFEADACVIIKDHSTFAKLMSAQGAHHFPDTQYTEGRAVYVDPLLPRTANINVPMSKHFRYEYQQEHRFIWQPIEQRGSLPYVDMVLGSLKDIAELVVV